MSNVLVSCHNIRYHNFTPVHSGPSPSEDGVSLTPKRWWFLYSSSWMILSDNHHKLLVTIIYIIIIFNYNQVWMNTFELSLSAAIFWSLLSNGAELSAIVIFAKIVMYWFLRPRVSLLIGHNCNMDLKIRVISIEFQYFSNETSQSLDLYRKWCFHCSFQGHN